MRACEIRKFEADSWRRKGIVIVSSNDVELTDVELKIMLVLMDFLNSIGFNNNVPWKKNI